MPFYNAVNLLFNILLTLKIKKMNKNVRKVNSLALFPNFTLEELNTTRL
jgi:hypothetical protein